MNYVMRKFLVAFSIRFFFNVISLSYPHQSTIFKRVRRLSASF